MLLLCFLADSIDFQSTEKGNHQTLIMNINPLLAKSNHYLFQASKDVTRSTVNMSSGKNESLKRDDAGGFAVANKLNHKKTVESSISANLQNLNSFIHVQDGIIESLISVTNRMGEIASKSTDVLLSPEQRENYNKEFLQLVDQFTSLQNETFNGNKLFKTNFSDEKTEFLESLKNNWLKAAEDLTAQVYGWTVNTSDSWDLIINELDTGGYAAFVTTAQYGDGTADVIDMQFDSLTLVHLIPSQIQLLIEQLLMKLFI